MSDHSENKKAAEKGEQPEVLDKQGPKVKTVNTNNDNEDPGQGAEKDSSNKGKGPKGEDL